jgi:hypothetical protein
MLKPSVPPVFPSGPLNLNPDGSTITYKKSHVGPNATNWEQADLKKWSAYSRPGRYNPSCLTTSRNKIKSQHIYVNPVCAEKVKDDGTLKFRTRATIGGDRIDYPYSTTAITAELEAIKILLNAMISDNAQFFTIDLEDFYLGTSLPFPEFIRIPAKFVPKKVITFYKLKQVIHKGALSILHCVKNPLWATRSKDLIPTTTLRPPRAKQLLSTVPHTFDLPQPQRHCQVLARCRRLRRRLVQQNGHESLHPNPTTAIVYREGRLEWWQIPRHDDRH